MTNEVVSVQVIEYGGGVRSTGATGVNSDSSRSHAILQLDVKVIRNEEHVGRYILSVFFFFLLLLLLLEFCFFRLWDRVHSMKSLMDYLMDSDLLSM